MTQRSIPARVSLPPPDWVPPQAPIGFDGAMPGSSAKARVVHAMTAMLEAFGPMTADQMTAALVIYGFGPLLDEMDAPPPKRPRQRRRLKGPRWTQAHLPDMD